MPARRRGGLGWWGLGISRGRWGENGSWEYGDARERNEKGRVRSLARFGALEAGDWLAGSTREENGGRQSLRSPCEPSPLLDSDAIHGLRALF